jgi:hypothetical protein
MVKLSYSNIPVNVSIAACSDVDLTLPVQNGEILQYDTTNARWKNSTGGGGGGASIGGTDDAAVFKSGFNGDGDSTAITRNPASANYTLNLDTVNKRLAINGQTPTETLEVNGTASFTDGAIKLKIDGDELGTETDSLKLYSHNTVTTDAVTEIDSQSKFVSSSTLISLPNTSFDTPNGTNDTGFYKIQLARGFPQQAGGGLFDQQENYDPTQTQFPSGQMVEYQNSLPLNFPVIIGRSATAAVITPASVYAISLFGTRFSFQDRCIYDPCQMRSRLQGVGWIWAGAPVQYRNSDIKAMLNVKWYFEGRWSGSSQQNRCDIYVNQFRAGVLLRNYLVAKSNNADSCFMSGERTFMGNALYGEDIDWSRDDFQVEIANMSPANNISADLGQTELRFIIAS